MGRRRITPEFKPEEVKLVKERGVAVRRAAADRGLHENVLRKWVCPCRGPIQNSRPPAFGSTDMADSPSRNMASRRGRVQASPPPCRQNLQSSDNSRSYSKSSRAIGLSAMSLL